MITTTSTNGVHHAADEAIDALYSWFPPQAPAPQPLPEAAFSLTLKGTLGGHEALLTARGMTAAEFRRNLEAITGLLDGPQAPKAPAPASGQGEGWCVPHNVAMQENHKDGRTWWSHKTADGWCKGRK